MWRKFLMSRKFVLAVLTLAFASVALPLDWLTGGEWVTAATLVMGAYGAANILQPKLDPASSAVGDDADKEA